MKFLAPYTSALAFSVAVGLLSTSPFTSAHSWLECTDYQFTPGSDAARVWDPLLCHGRARCGRRQMESKFGADTGFNIHTSAKCQCERGDAENQGDRKAPVASYTPGQRVCLAYPPKNHVADGDCTNANIPDSGVRITRTAVNPTSDDPKGFIKDYEQGNGKHVNGQVDYKGFQNCPNFCQNKEGALCTMCFDLENDIAPGEYTFKWIWAFNSADDEYSSCWEATIGSKDGAGGDENKDEKSPESPSPSSPQVSPTPSPTPSSLQVTSMSVPLPSSLQASPTPSPTPSPSPSSSEPPASDEQLDMPESPSSSTGSDIDEECEEELDVAGSTEGDELEIPGDAEAENGDGSPTPATTMPAYQGEVGAEGGNDDGEVDDDSNCEQGIPIANTRAPGAQGYSHDSNANQMPEAEVGGEADDPDANSSGSALDEDENCEHGVSMADTNAPEPAPEGAAGADATLSPEATPDTQDGEDDDCSRAHPGGLPYSYPLEKQKQYQNGRVHPDKSFGRFNPMEKSRISQRRQQFREQLDELDAELQALEAAATEFPSSAPSGSSGSNTDGVRSAQHQSQQQILRLHYQMADLCGQHQDYKRAAVHYRKVLDWLDAQETKHEDSPAKPVLTRNASTTVPAEAPPCELSVKTSCSRPLSANDRLLKENVLNNLSTMCFGAGDHARAMGYLLDAKKLNRGRAEQLNHAAETSDHDRNDPVARDHLEKILAANYALFLHANGNIEDAIHAASSVVEVKPLDDGQEDAGVDTIRAKIAALSLLSSCWKSKGDDEQAMEFAKQAAQLADHIQDHVLLSRTQNNLALYHFARRDFSTALHHLLTAFRATHAIQDFQQQGIVKYHIGLVLSELEIDIELPQSSRTDSTRHFSAAAPGEVTMVEQGNMHGHASRKSLAGAAMTTAKDCFVQSENLAAVLPEQDHVLKVLAHGCRGETEYYAGEFHTAEAEFSIALQRLQEILYPENSASGGIAGTPTASNDADAIGSVDPGELVKIQGFLLSYMGCTQLVEGKFELAEESHQCDLEIALKHEDIHAQLRAMRNLALVYNSTQRYQEAIPLWREALEIACVLQSKVDQMMAYSGLGIAMNELRITDQKGEFKELLDLKENNPLHIFLRQRALAIELGDKNQQIVAQRHIVSTYESLDQPDIEQRLAECDTLVRLSEQYENLQYRSDGYRSLANALTAQLARLSARGARFAEAVQVLTQKRDSVCVKYQQATKTLKMAAAMMLKADDSDATPDARKKPYKEDKHPRPPITRVDMLQRK